MTDDKIASIRTNKISSTAFFTKSTIAELIKTLKLNIKPKLFPCVDTWKHPSFTFSDTIFRMKKANYLLITLIFILITIMLIYLFSRKKENISYIRSRIKQSTTLPTQAINPPTPTPLALNPIPSLKVLVNNYYAKQTFNNCGPASLSMALSYYGIFKSQQEIGNILRPYQNPIGDNDDKSVTLEELGVYAKIYGFTAYHRPNGSIELLKKFITHDIPVITRTWLHTNDDIGHYRIVKGFDDNTGSIIQDDSYEGPNLSFSYSDFNTMWEKFDYEYLVLIPEDKLPIAKAIIGENLNDNYAWQQVVERNIEKLKTDPNDIYSKFNLSVAYYHLGKYEKSVQEFEKVEDLLPFRTLWYQIEPIEAYYMLGNYDRVLSITDKILSNHNRAYSELYILRGKIYQKQGSVSLAKSEFEKAVFYNKNLKEAKAALESINNI